MPVNAGPVTGVSLIMTTQTRLDGGAQRVLARLLLRVTGAGLLIASAGVHLDLYATGYRTIPTIGWLFLIQVVAGFVLGLVVLATGRRLLAAAAALFALLTLGGYLLSVQVGLFGFREVRTTAGITAGLLEVLAFAPLAVLAVTQRAPIWRWRLRHERHGSSQEVPPQARNWRVGLVSATVTGRQAGIGAAVVSVIALGLMAGVLAGAVGGTGGISGGQAAVGSALRTNSVGGRMLLANADGRTVYYFAADSPGKSTCYDDCALYWTPVAGPLTAGPGVTGKLGTIRRKGGELQETYNDRPLYTYVGDSGPAQTNGNDIDLNGGYWYDLPVSG
jgi:predicted lipoprotein with Yx(FWY)xxD motif